MDTGMLEASRSADLAAALTRAQVRLVLSDPAGRVVMGNASPSRIPVATREAAQVALPWTIRVVAADPSGLSGYSRTRRAVAIAGFVVMALILVGGSYAAARAVVRELSAARMQSEFVATVSHEFRTPLAAIRHVSDLLVDGRVSDDRRERYYQALQAESERLQRLVETLLDFRRIEEGARPYRMDACDPTALLTDLAGRFRSEAARRGYELEADIEPGLPLLMADGAALTLAVWNLLDNAVKYSPACKTVRIEARADATGVAIAVTDRGLGIAKAEARRVFARFMRGTSAAASGAGGTGLGLAIVSHIVDAHRGTVTFESEPGTGTTFIIRIPGTSAEAST
jgi:signal transduction histidine kinase